jgi:hypothetical protein
MEQIQNSLVPSTTVAAPQSAVGAPLSGSTGHLGKGDRQSLGRHNATAPLESARLAI